MKTNIEYEPPRQTWASGRPRWAVRSTFTLFGFQTSTWEFFKDKRQANAAYRKYTRKDRP